MRNELENFEVRERLPRRARHFLEQPETPLGVDERAVLLAPARAGQNEMRRLRRLGAGVHVLHHEEVELAEQVAGALLLNPRMHRVGGDDPERLDLARLDAVENLVVGQAVPRGNVFHGHTQQPGNFLAMLGLGEIVAADQVGRVAEEARAHRIALAGDGIRSRAGPPNVPGHQRQIDDGLRRAGGLVPLIHPHRPPERNAFALMDGLGEPVELFEGKAGGRRDGSFIEIRSRRGHETLINHGRIGWTLVTSTATQKLNQLLKPVRVLRDELVIHPAAFDQDARQPVEQRQVTLGLQCVMLRRRHRRLGAARIDDDDFRLMGIHQHALPHDGMGDAQVGADEHDDVGLLEILVGVGRRVEAERLLVSRHGRGHALARVAVPMHDAHAELGQRTEEGQFLIRNLPRPNPRHRLRAVLILDGLHPHGEDLQRGVPIDGFEFALLVAQQRRGRAVGRGQRCERLPAFRAGHAEVHRVIARRAQVDGLAVAQMHVQPAARGAEAADHRGGAVRREARGNFAKAEVAGTLDQFLGQRSRPLAQERGDFARDGFHAECGGVGRERMQRTPKENFSLCSPRSFAARCLTAFQFTTARLRAFSARPPW